MAAETVEDTGLCCISPKWICERNIKLGYSFDQATELSRVSSIYANVGEVDDATAVSDIVTAMKAFNIEASDSITIIDQLNALGKIIAHVYSNIYLASSYIG